MSENNQNEVRKEPHVMSRDDVNDYDGLTLNEQGEQEERSAEDSFIHIYMIHIHELPWWKKLLGGLGIAVFILLGLVLVWLFFIYGAIVLATVRETGVRQASVFIFLYTVSIKNDIMI